MYGYDERGRLSRKAFPNGMETTYTYNSMNQLISRIDAINEETYTYDKRVNLSLIMENGALKNRYTYGAINRIEQAVNGKGDSALYAYNGLGHRTGRETNRGRVDYLIDLTRPYHNMLMMTDAEKSRTFYWDGNVSAMSESRTRGTAELSVPDGTTDRIASGAYGITPIFHYYLQDDLGSPLRVSGYGIDTEGKNSGYLTYGYDEFGNDLYDSLYNDMEDAGSPNPYSRQGEEQPFGYTGYRRDDISGTYFAQAREYQPQNGRFTAEDVIKGNVAFPETLNQYGYCFGNPEKFVDLNGLEPEQGNYYVYYLNNMDGAKVFGHNAILLVDDKGNGAAYSYMGAINTGNLLEFFAPELNSVMGYAELSPDEVKEFLQDGNITFTKYITGNYFVNRIPMTENRKGIARPVETSDNYDRALRKQLTEEEYQTLSDEMERIGKDDNKKYSLYTYNCDTAVVEAISEIDNDFDGYTASDLIFMLMFGKTMFLRRDLTPNTSFNSRQSRESRRESLNRWELVYLGDISIKEKFLKNPLQFDIEPDEIASSLLEMIYSLYIGIGRKIKCIE